jgi:putative lipoic acid-binding regulatory protein
LDDLDVRIASKIGERQTGGSKRRGSWQMTAENLQLISSHCPGFEKLTSLTKELTEVGLGLQAGEAKKRDEAYNNFAEIKVRIREELENIVATRDSSDGLELLKKSLTLSGTYKDLTLKIREAESEEQLEELYSQIELETNVYNQRAKHLQNLFTQQSEFVKSANMDLPEVLAEVRTLGAKTVEELDF